MPVLSLVPVRAQGDPSKKQALLQTEEGFERCPQPELWAWHT